ncbi:MAG: glycosyltransferase [Thermoanaerobaculia bacterium]
MTRLVAVVAAYDEEETIEVLTRRLLATFLGMEGVEAELLFVVEGRDRTREILEGLARESPGIRILYNPEPSGLGAAFRRGFDAVPADADFVVTLDADLNHQPEEIPRLLERLRQTGADILVGSRFLKASEVEGSPLWKKALSGSINVLMRFLYGVSVKDKTSGFRLYRAEALRRIDFRRSGFAFLPEMLIRAHVLGLRVTEEPIHFIFRRQGRSKMDFWRTSLSYLALLSARFDARTLAVLGLLLAGMAVRTAVTYPVHKYMADADSLLTGMQAFHVLHGEAPVFFSGTRLGSIEPHAAAAVFLVAGASRTSLAAVPLIFALLLLLAAYGLYRELFPPGVALTALAFLALPSPSFLSWSYMPNGYPAVLFLCATLLWLAARLKRRGPSPAGAVLFGFVAGLGLWQSFQTLGALAAALAWLLWNRPDLRRQARPWVLGLAGFVVGAFPWLAFNVVRPLDAIQGNFAAQPAQGMAAIAANARYFVTYSLPEIVTPVNEAWTQFLADPAADLHRLLRLPVQLLFAAAALLFLAAPALPGRAGRAVRRREDLPAWLLLVLVTAAYAALNILSQAGQVRGFSVRYVLPLYLVVPAMLAVLLSLVAARSRVLAVLLAGMVLVFNLTAYHWPGRASREAWREGARRDDRLVELLRQRGVTAVVGGYWTAYPINFLTHESILALPCTADHYGYGYRRTPGRLYRWALVSARPEQLQAWAAQAGVTGSLELAAPQRAILLLTPNPADPEAQEKLLVRLAKTCKLAD